jgi:hypothetical protein
MQVNDHSFTIYPDFKSKMTLDDHADIHLDSSISTGRQIVLANFYRHLGQAFKNSQNLT